MKKKLVIKKVKLCCALKILAIIYAVFLGLFAFDAFLINKDFFQVLIIFLSHLIPSIMIMTVTLIACKRQIIGGALFILTGIILSMRFSRDITSLVGSIALFFPLSVIGGLFIAAGIRNQ